MQNLLQRNCVDWFFCIPHFFRFPHTPHIAWLTSGAPRDDKVLTRQDASALLGTDVVREEKLEVSLGLVTVPRLRKGMCTLPQLKEMLNSQRSQFRQGSREGIVIRHESAQWCEARAKSAN